MIDTLFPFQEKALHELRDEVADALGSYNKRKKPQVVSYTAPTGAGKTIIITSLIEKILFGGYGYADQPEAIFVWLSDDPSLNEQSKNKVVSKSDRIRIEQCITIDDGFTQDILSDGCIYFLNTQKLSVSSNITKHYDARQYSIWDVMRNTVNEKSDRLYFIIDEAHRGATQYKEQTTIMQKFIKGSPSDQLPQMPVVIGMSATSERFNALVENCTTSTMHYVVTTADEVRSSGLLKDKIYVVYPDNKSNEISILKAASEDWIEKCNHWKQYCEEQKTKVVNPVFVIQVLNKVADSEKDTETNLEECITTIESVYGKKFKEGEVVHTFGQASQNIIAAGLKIKYVEPSNISDDRSIKVVFFKTNLSTGWDCPRAETMLSFRKANDYTFIAQLLGRMVRTPLQRRILVDESLNDVHLFLPHFDAQTVSDVVSALQKSEGGAIGLDVVGESISDRKTQTLSIHIGDKQNELDTKSGIIDPAPQNGTNTSNTNGGIDYKDPTSKPSLSKKATDNNSFNREEILKFINSLGLSTYKFRRVRINSYFDSLLSLVRLLSNTSINKEERKNEIDKIISKIRSHIESLKESGEYEDLKTKVREFKLNTKIFDVFGDQIDFNSDQQAIATETDIDRQFRLAESLLGNEGIGLAYVEKYIDSEEMIDLKIDVIIFTADSECLKALQDFSQQEFYAIKDKYKDKTRSLNDKYHKLYEDIVSNSDVVTDHPYIIPEVVNITTKKGIEYEKHLYANNEGKVNLNLGTWESDVLKEEMKRDDFVCWLRNPQGASWSLCVKYDYKGTITPAYPDLIIIRRDGNSYKLDIIEPHMPSLDDNLYKAKGFAEYSKLHTQLSRFQMVREVNDASGNAKYKRLNLASSKIQDLISKLQTPAEFDHLFDVEGVIET